MMKLLLTTAYAAFAFASTAAAAAEPITPAQLEFFESKIRPLLVEHCYSCHNSVDKKKGDLALDYRGGILEAKAVIPGDPAKSPLILSVRHAGDFEPMPSKAPKLSNLSIKHLEDWVAMGAPDPRTEKPTTNLAGKVDWPTVRDKRAEWWSFRPVVKSEPPQADDPTWNRGAIDRFIFAGLKAKGLQPAPLADPGTLVRRLHLVLTGLPAKPHVVEAFVADPSEQVYAALVDELLKSPAYGERWARYWMDWYRYAESYGSEGDPAIPNANQYRDYLVRAIRSDVSYDQLIREHLAGDLLEKPRINSELGINESVIGTSQLRMVPHGFGVANAYDEQITFTDNQIDVVSKAMLALTVSCARCHDHKFDPISQKDFYRFYGIMVSSRPAIRNIDSPALQNLHRAEIEQLKSVVRGEFGNHWLGEVDAAIERLEKAEVKKLAEHPAMAAWVKVRDMAPEEVKRQLDAMRQSYQAGIEHNALAKKNAKFYADLRDQATYDRWFRSGNGLGAKVSPAGSFALAGEGGRAFSGIYPAGVYTHLISDKHSGFLNSVFQLAQSKHAGVRAFGSKAFARFPVRSYPLIHGGLHPAPDLKPVPAWIPFAKNEYWKGEKFYFQLNTAADNTVSRGDGRGWFGVLEAYAGNEGMRELGVSLDALSADIGKVGDRASLLQFYRSALRTGISAWLAGKATDAQAQLLDGFVSGGLLTNEVAALPAPLKALVDSYRKLESAIRIPIRAPGVAEGEPWEQPLLTRGDHKKEEQPVERGFLEIMPGKPYPKTNSGRRELAEDMLKDSNPLTSRVIVNRLWHHTFGRGLVASADNFGRLGDEPTHPQLLDYLAAEFRGNGWSMKQLVRHYVMSRTFRSASSAPVANGEKDELNVQLAYFTPRRLDAEAILDSIQFVAAKDTPQRSVYKPVKRNDLNEFLAAFNYPIPTATVGVRNQTNVPAQALTLMNGQIANASAERWGRRLKDDKSLATDELKIKAIFMDAYSRPASPAELAACLDFIRNNAPERDPYVQIAHAVLNSKEFIYVY